MIVVNRPGLVIHCGRELGRFSIFVGWGEKKDKIGCLVIKHHVEIFDGKVHWS